MSVVRLAVVISANVGMPTDTPLRFADVDGDRVAAVLRDLGGIEGRNLFRARDAGVDDVTEAIRQAVLRGSELDAAGHETELLLYYTGHAGVDGLHLQGEVLPLPSLKTAGRVVPAERRVFVVDACQSGQMLRSKGATLVHVDDAPAEFTPPADEAWIASTGPEEQAFEVDRRRGSLFTHFFVSGARGPADDDLDGEVTLGELYHYVQGHTESAAAGLGVVQRPRWAGDLDTMVVSAPRAATEGIETVGPLREPMLVVDVARNAVVAEFPAGADRRLALPPGRYQLVAASGSRRVRSREVRVVPGDFTRVTVDDMRERLGVRTKGGLIDPVPFHVAAGYVGAVGTAAVSPVSHGAWVGVRRSLGRGHRAELGLEGGSVGFVTRAAEGSDRWLGIRAQWGYDVRAFGVRTGPGLEVGGGGVQQRAHRAADPDWGDWYGEASGDRATWHGFVRALPGWSVEVPVGPVWLVGFGGAGVHVFTAERLVARPLAQVRLGVAFGGANR